MNLVAVNVAPSKPAVAQKTTNNPTFHLCRPATKKPKGPSRYPVGKFNLHNHRFLIEANCLHAITSPRTPVIAWTFLGRRLPVLHFHDRPCPRSPHTGLSAVVEARGRASAPTFARAAIFTASASARIMRCLLSAVRALAGALRSCLIGRHGARLWLPTCSEGSRSSSGWTRGLHRQGTGRQSDCILIGASPSWMASREGG